MKENEMKKVLKDWLKSRGRSISEKEVQMIPMKYGDKTNKPDVFAYKKRSNTIILIECKRATRLRYIGHAFGQILVTKLAFKKMKKLELKSKLSKITGKNNIDDLKIEFGVAFPRTHIDSSKSILRMLNMFHQLLEFKDFSVYLVTEDSVERKHRGKPTLYKELRGS